MSPNELKKFNELLQKAAKKETITQSYADVLKSNSQPATEKPKSFQAIDAGEAVKDSDRNLDPKSQLDNRQRSDSHTDNGKGSTFGVPSSNAQTDRGSKLFLLTRVVHHRFLEVILGHQETLNSS